MKLSIIISTLLISGIVSANDPSVINMKDFLRDFYHSSTGRSEVAGSTKGTINPDGETAMAINFDFSKCPDSNNSFFRFHMDRVLPARPQAIRIEYFNLTTDEIPVTIWMTDKNGEIFLGRGIAHPNNQKRSTLEIAIHPYPAWDSGDKNGQIDYPLNFNAILIDMPSRIKTGSLVINKVDVKLQADMENCMVLNMASEIESWGNTTVPFELNIQSLSDKFHQDLTLNVIITNDYTQKNYTLIDKKINSDKSITIKENLTIPYGSYQGIATIKNDNNIMDTKKFAIQNLAFDGANWKNDSEKIYEYNYGINGGVHGFLTPQTAEKIGMNWIRLEVPNWGDSEISPNQYDFSRWLDEANKWDNANVRNVLLQCTYNYPKFVKPKEVNNFSRSYGQYFKNLFQQKTNKVNSIELGNEDNGHNKFLYTELARNGASAIRSERPFAVISNSGTAFVDVNFLKFQGSRGLLNYFDAYCVHPYTNNAAASQSVSPELFKTGIYLTNLMDLAFASGGMKELWCTEFGWPNGNPQEEHDRADLYVRQMLITDAYEFNINGLYTWDRDYGIMRRPAGIAINYFAKNRRGTRFLGQLAENNIYYNLYQKDNQNIVVLWTPYDKIIKLKVNAESITDQFGNKIDKNEIEVNNSVIYLANPDKSLVEKIANAGVNEAKNRFVKYFNLANNKSKFANLINIDATNSMAIKSELSRICNTFNTPISMEDRGLFDFAWRWYFYANRSFGKGESKFDVDNQSYINKVVAENQKGLDYPALRYLLRQLERLEVEYNLYAEDSLLQAKINSEKALLADYLKLFSNKEMPFQYGVFSTIYDFVDGEATEKLKFVPSKESALRLRVSNYLNTQAKAQIKINLPENWKISKNNFEVELMPNQDKYIDLTITATDSLNSQLTIGIDTTIDGNTNKVVLDQIELLPAISAKFDLQHNSLANEGLKLKLTNLEKQKAKGKIKLMPHLVSGGALAIIDFELAPESKQDLTINLNDVAKQYLADSDYKIDLLYILDNGKRFRQDNLDVEFLTATQAKTPILIDGNLQEWQDALPIRLNKMEYTNGSFGNNYSIDDCSAAAYLKYDDDNLYFGCIVRDQTFHQRLSNDVMWQQDSIQLVFAPTNDSKDYIGLTLALSNGKAAIWHETERRIVDEAQMEVKLGNEFIYEAKIPWSSLSAEIAEQIKKNKSFVYGIAINDDDAIVPRRSLERFPDTVVHGKNINNFAKINLIDNPIMANANNKVRLRENFDSYNTNNELLGYTILNYGNTSDVIVKIQDDKSLYLANNSANSEDNKKIISEDISVTPGKRYRLSFDIKGDTKGIFIGLATDVHGVIDHNYLKVAESNPTWTSYVLEFVGGETGHRKLIMRNDNPANKVYIRNIKVEEL